MSDQIKQLISATLNEDYVEFESVFEDLLSAKISAMLSEALDENDIECPECGCEVGNCDCYDETTGPDGEED